MPRGEHSEELRYQALAPWGGPLTLRCLTDHQRSSSARRPPMVKFSTKTTNAKKRPCSGKQGCRPESGQCGAPAPFPRFCGLCISYKGRDSAATGLRTNKDTRGFRASVGPRWPLGSHRRQARAEEAMTGFQCQPGGLCSQRTPRALGAGRTPAPPVPISPPLSYVSRRLWRGFPSVPPPPPAWLILNHHIINWMSPSEIRKAPGLNKSGSFPNYSEMTITTRHDDSQGR